MSISKKVEKAARKFKVKSLDNCERHADFYEKLG
jgi:hypothetical protein